MIVTSICHECVMKADHQQSNGKWVPYTHLLPARASVRARLVEALRLLVTVRDLSGALVNVNTQACICCQLKT